MSKVECDRKENNRQSKNLTKENDKIFTDIVCYLRVSYLSENDQEEIISDILRLFLDCQKDGKSIKNMVGGDYKKFTDEIISAIEPKKSFSKITKEYLGIILEAFCIMLSIDFIFLFLPKITKGSFKLRYDYDLSMFIRFIILIVIASIVIKYIGKKSFELSKKSFSMQSKFIVGGGVGVVIVFFIGIIKLFEDVIIISIDIRYVIGIIVVYWVYKVVKKVKYISILE